MAVAVKALRPYGDIQTRKRVAKRLVREIDVWARLNHPNVLRLIGFCLAPDRSAAWIISSLCRNGNAQEYLKSTNPGEVNRVKLVIDTVKGLRYLHESSPPIYHGDLKAAHVLITDDIQAVLCDFGLARVRSDETGLTTTDAGGATHYMSPEIAWQEDELRCTMESDIWEWGCLVLEMMKEQAPYAEAESGGSVYMRLANDVAPADVGRLSVAQPIAKLIKECWSFAPEERPRAHVCLQIVDQYYRELSQRVRDTPLKLIDRVPLLHFRQ